MPITDHPSFNRPPVSTLLWRYTDFPKFVDLLTSSRLWLTSAEILAAEDPYEGWPGPIRFPHRNWRTIDEVPQSLRSQILQIYGRGKNDTPQSAFRSWVMIEEQACLMSQFGRRDYYMSCWHAAPHESMAMWKVYASPGAGVAIVTNGARMESALSANTEQLNLGAVKYQDPNVFEIGSSNGFNALLVKRSSYAYENEVRLVHWDTKDVHNPLPEFSWNETTMRFDNIVEDRRPISPGLSLECDVDVLVAQVIISPFAPAWYLPMIERLKTALGYQFQVIASRLLHVPPVLP